MALTGQAMNTGLNTTSDIQGLTVSNTTSSNLILESGQTWTSISSNPPMESSIFDSKFGRHAMKKLVGMSCKIEELFDYKYRICPEENSYAGYALSFNISITENKFCHDPGTPVSTWSETLLDSVQDDGNGKMRKSELLHATAKMIFSVMYFRTGDSQLGHVPSRNEPNEIARDFIYDIARGYVFEDAEVPEEALDKLALLTL